MKGRDGRVCPWALALMEMLVDPMLVCWVPGWVVEQYERWNPDFRKCVDLALDADDKVLKKWYKKRPTTTNLQLLKRVRVIMMRKYEKRLERDARAVREGGAAGEGEEAESSHGAQDSQLESDDDPERGQRAAQEEDEMTKRRVLLREPAPGEGDDSVAPGGDPWSGLSLAEQLSAAAPAAEASPVFVGGAAAGDGSEHPVTVPLVWQSVVGVEQKPRLEALWVAYRDKPVRNLQRADEREVLDPWQRFAYDIVREKAVERAARCRSDPYSPARLFLTGGAGSGKTRTVRAFVQAYQDVVRARGSDQRDVDNCCKLAAPTGCASFHLKGGASTCHRLFGARESSCGKVTVRLHCDEGIAGKAWSSAPRGP